MSEGCSLLPEFLEGLHVDVVLCVLFQSVEVDQNNPKVFVACLVLIFTHLVRVNIAIAALIFGEDLDRAKCLPVEEQLEQSLYALVTL